MNLSLPALKQTKRGGALAVVLLLLMAVAFIAFYLSNSTVNKTTQTQRAQGGDQAASLADAGVARAVRMLCEQVNKLPALCDAGQTTGATGQTGGRALAKEKNLGLMLRCPLKVLQGGAKNPSPVGLGPDEELDVSGLKTVFPEGCIKLTLADLRVLGEGEDWLDQLVGYGTKDKVASYDLNVTVTLDKAFRVAPKSFAEDNGLEYLVPGVDCDFAAKTELKDFLDNKGRSKFIGRFPEWLKLFEFTIPVKVHIPVIDKDIILVEIDPSVILNPLIMPITKGTGLAKAMKCPDGIGLNDFFSLDKILMAIATLIGKPNWYPIIPDFDKDFFTTADKLWPAGIQVPKDYSGHVEKYGLIKFVSEATITFTDGTSSLRKVEASKDFKVSDIMPMAPMYSMFVANTPNSRFDFNNYGGQVYINNSAGRLLKKEQRKELKEHPGQIRVNFEDTAFSKGEISDANPLVINVSMLGNYSGLKLSKSGNAIADAAQNLISGADALMILGRTDDMVLAKSSYNVDFTVNSRNVKIKDTSNKSENVKANRDDKNTKVTKRIILKEGKINKGFQLQSDMTDKCKFLNRDPTYLANRKKYQTSALKKANEKKSKWWAQPPYAGSNEDNSSEEDDKKDKDKKKNRRFSFIPDPAKFSSSIIAFGIAKALDLLAAMNPIKGIKLGDEDDTFANMDLPFMGTTNSFYTLPTLGFGLNKTHLFGQYAMYPTLSRDIEGLVAKRYRHWKLTIVGLFAKDRLPLLPVPPYFVPPIPVPYWETQQRIEKYDYDLWFLKALDAGPKDNTAEIQDKVDIDRYMHYFSPSEMINMPANFYSVEQYAKKSNYFYACSDDFIKDLPNRMVATDQKGVLQLNGVTFIAGSLGKDDAPFKITPEILRAVKGFDGSETDTTLYVMGRGMIVAAGNIIIDCDIRYVKSKDKDDPTVFSLIARNGGIAFPNVPPSNVYILEGSYFSNRGLYIADKTCLNIQGNWVTNLFDKQRMCGELLVDYVASNLRPSLGSLHYATGKYDPKRYHLALSPRWKSWKVD